MDVIFGNMSIIIQRSISSSITLSSSTSEISSNSSSSSISSSCCSTGRSSAASDLESTPRDSYDKWVLALAS